MTETEEGASETFCSNFDAAYTVLTFTSSSCSRSKALRLARFVAVDSCALTDRALPNASEKKQINCQEAERLSALPTLFLSIFRIYTNLLFRSWLDTAAGDSRPHFGTCAAPSCVQTLCQRRDLRVKSLCEVAFDACKLGPWSSQVVFEEF